MEVLALDTTTSSNNHLIMEQILRLERRIFPKHESLVPSFHHQLSRKNSGLLYALLPPPTPQNPSPQVVVAGYIIYTFTSSLAASIIKLAVRESCRKQGYGEALLKAAIDKCRTRAVSRVILHVDPAREAAMCLYKKMGFKIDAVVQSYYAPHRDAYRMFIDYDTS